MVRIFYSLFLTLFTVTLFCSCTTTNTTQQRVIQITDNPFEISFEVYNSTRESGYCFGDSLDLIIFFKNRTDSIVGLSGLVTLDHFRDFDLFISGIPPGIILNKKKRYNNSIKVPSGEIYKDTYRIIISDEFFFLGINYLTVRFLNGALYHSIFSPKIELTVEECNTTP